MNAIFKKLNYKNQHQIFIITAPNSFEKDLKEMGLMTIIKTNLAGAKEVEFLLAFVTSRIQKS